jgi:hypothetical protein
MLLLGETIRPLFAHPDTLANRFHAIAVGCRDCKSLDTYILHKDFPGHNPQDTVKLTRPEYGDVVRLKSLECAEENCGILLPVFAHFHRAATTEERKAIVDSWRWENFHCPQGHKIGPRKLY